MKVKDLMTRDVACCRARDPASAAAKLMWERDCGALPVLDGDGKTVVGMVTDRDLCMGAWSRDCAPSQFLVADVMAKTLYSCAPDETLAAAEALMRTRQIRRVPVLDPGGELLGIVSIADIARHAAQEMGRPAGRLELKETLETLVNICEPHQPVEYA
jgi:CBS domain-containing protein